MNINLPFLTIPKWRKAFLMALILTSTIYTQLPWNAFSKSLKLEQSRPMAYHSNYNTLSIIFFSLYQILVPLFIIFVSEWPVKDFFCQF
jgi:preprotein translocase subunit SecY